MLVWKSFRKPIFRNDDVSVDSNLENFKKFCAIFHKFGYKQLHGINLYGYTNCAYLYDEIPVPYEGFEDIAKLDYSTIKSLSQDKFIGNNIELIEYLNSTKDEIALHGLYHSDYSKMSEEEQNNDIKEGLKLLKELFPNKKVKVFIAPFNRTNASTYEVCTKYGLKVSADEGEHFEDMISQKLYKIQSDQVYRFHHHRFYPESTFKYYDLSIKKLDNFFAVSKRKRIPNAIKDTIQFINIKKLISFLKTSKKKRKLPTIHKVKHYINKNNAPLWHAYAFENLKDRKHNYLPYLWIKKNINKKASILETGCGTGGILYHLCKDGFNNLNGYDYDVNAINAANEITNSICAKIDFSINDGTNPVLENKYDVIIGLSWIHHVDGFGLEEFIKNHMKYLNVNGYFVFEIVDAAYNDIEKNQYLTSDWDKPENKREPSEYKVRYSTEQVEHIAKMNNLEIIKAFHCGENIPRTAYILKDKRPRICLLCDKPNWAFDNSAQEIVNLLSSDFYFDIKYVVDNPKLFPKNYDLMHVFFWGETCYKKYKWPSNKIIKEVSSHRWQDNPQFGLCSPKQVVSKYLKDSDTVFCTSKKLFDLLKDEHKNVHLTQNGYNPSKFFYTQERSGDMKICWAGNINDPVKQVNEILIPACENKFNLNLASCLSHKEMCEFYNNNDIYVVCSKNEAEPLTLLEALASGCFPVCLDVGLVPELIRHKENGYIVGQGTQVAFIDAFEWCQNNLEYIRMQSKKNAQELFTLKRWEIMAKGFNDLYNSALKGN